VNGRALSAQENCKIVCFAFLTVSLPCSVGFAAPFAFRWAKDLSDEFWRLCYRPPLCVFAYAVTTFWVAFGFFGIISIFVITYRHVDKKHSDRALKAIVGNNLLPGIPAR
jgi:hypothetical protein